MSLQNFWWRLGVFGVLPLILILGVVGQVDAQGPGPWIDDPANPVYDPFNAAYRAYYPTVLYDSNAFGDAANPAYTVVTPYYKMWFTFSPNLGLAYSEDGVTWVEYYTEPATSDMALPGLTVPHHNRVLYDAGGFGGGAYTYKIWYWDSGQLYGPCVPPPPSDPGARCSIRYAESSDGITWEHDQAVFGGTGQTDSDAPDYWQKGSYGPSDVLYFPGASNTGTNPFNYSYIMYYNGTSGGTEELGLAYSADGITWTRYTFATPIFPNGADGDWDEKYAAYGTVRWTGSQWEMWYSGGVFHVYEGIGYATSPDGLTWTKAVGNPILSLGVSDGLGVAGAWNSERNYTPTVLYSASRFDGHGAACHYKMWRTGWLGSSGDDYTIGYACADPVPPDPPDPPPAEEEADDDDDDEEEVLPPTPTASPVIIDPALSKRGDPVNALPGEQITWTVTVANNSTIPLTDVVVLDTVDERWLALAEVTVSRGQIAVVEQVVTWTLGEMAPGEAQIMTLCTTAHQGLSGNDPRVNTVVMHMAEADPQTATAAVTLPLLLPDTGYPP
ncbi:hypothetical protein ACFLYO_02795, partial [Chloroflexota bacterium]